jgi:ParB-like nuclease domain
MSSTSNQIEQDNDRAVSQERSRRHPSNPESASTEAAGELHVIYRSIDTLTPYRGNARTHSRSQIRKLRDSIQAFGFVNPILINTGGTIVAGHGRVQAAKLLSMTEVPTICLENLTPDQIRAYVIADNRLAEDAGWDEQILKIELQHLISLPDIDHRLRSARDRLDYRLSAGR